MNAVRNDERVIAAARAGRMPVSTHRPYEPEVAKFYVSDRYDRVWINSAARPGANIIRLLFREVVA